MVEQADGLEIEELENDVTEMSLFKHTVKNT